MTSKWRLRVTVEPSPGDQRRFEFDRPFRIGRVEDCDVCIKNEYVSRSHAEVALDGDECVVRDLRSANGVFVDGQRVHSARVEQALTFRLGVYGPFVTVAAERLEPVRPAAVPTPEPENVPGEATRIAQYEQRYFGKGAVDQPAGEHTMFIRRAFERVQKKQKRKYGWFIASLAAAVLAAAGYAFYLHREVQKQTAQAEAIFYEMKSLDVAIAGLQKLVSGSNNQPGRREIEQYRAARREMQRHYDDFLASLQIEKKLSEKERVIFRVARIFGECELAMPRGFVPEVEKYIGYWHSTGKLAEALHTAESNGYRKKIAQELLDQGLPPQFFYLALQESGFDPYISGPPTRKGIAKGMWQFIPETATKYGLKLGPLAELRRPDPGDDRDHWELATAAAARYIRDLYSTDAQASGLLVMACYNWGEDQVLPLVQSMPRNPRDRNFWRLLELDRDKLPEETYNYVFYIFSAAVIGENPKLFGFDFSDPLGYLDVR
jgi:pSer/pThr/pTyr-binding forkhead associated (FHA) protein